MKRKYFTHTRYVFNNTEVDSLIELRLDFRLDVLKMQTRS